MNESPRRRPRVAWLPGDGIGPEVLDAARLVLDAVGFDAHYVPARVGWECWRREGNPLPEETIHALRDSDAALFGAITSKPAREADAELEPSLRGRGFVYRSPIVRIRQELDLYAKIVLARAYEGNPRNHGAPDLVVVRENTEGLYAGIEMRPVPEAVRRALREASPAWDRFDAAPAEEVAVGLRVVTYRGAQRIARAAFALARREGRDSVTLVEKPNVLRETSGLMTDAARATAREFPDIRLDEVNVDAMMMILVKDPRRHGVLLASNLFGDVLSDLCAELAGGIGLAPTANLGENAAVFEPLHGSAPKYAGRDIVNPVGAILSAGMMLDHLGESDRARRVREAVAATIREPAACTRDLGGNAGTRRMAEAIAIRAARTGAA